MRGLGEGEKSIRVGEDKERRGMMIGKKRRGETGKEIRTEGKESIV